MKRIEIFVHFTVKAVDSASGQFKYSYALGVDNGDGYDFVGNCKFVGNYDGLVNESKSRALKYFGVDNNDVETISFRVIQIY